MKTLLLATVLFLGASFAGAQTTFPGLKSVMTDAEWKRAGLDRLSPDELGVIDAALIRHQARNVSQLQAELTTARETAATAAAATPAITPEQKKGLLQRFGLPVFEESEWKSLPALKAKVVKWESSNRFKLDNGQVWEGVEPITYELLDRNIEIQARPHGQFSLIVEGTNTTLRVMRLR
jgi:hypothetical protein